MTWQLAFPQTNGYLKKQIPILLLLSKRSFFVDLQIKKQVSFPKVNYYTWGVQLQENAKKKKKAQALSKVAES